jgi:MinD superfamily P-loop ATPase
MHLTERKNISLKIAIASGKGGTGKTTLAANLAVLAARENGKTFYVDCDVEEPNGHIFLNPHITKSWKVPVPIPEVMQEKCIQCGKCQEICQYGSIVLIGKEVLVFPEMCHGCGGCMLVCPTKAIIEKTKSIGVVETGTCETGVNFIQGRLNIGEKLVPPLIRAVKKEMPTEGLVLIDAPPGSSCPVIEAVRGADYTILVTEPTPFGLNDLIIAVKMMRALDQPFGVAINRAGFGYDEVRCYLEREGVENLVEIPDDRRIAEAYSEGILAIDAIPEIKKVFRGLLSSIGAA